MTDQRLTEIKVQEAILFQLEALNKKVDNITTTIVKDYVQ